MPGLIPSVLLLSAPWLLVGASNPSAEHVAQLVPTAQVSNLPNRFTAQAGPTREFTWWLPTDAQDYVLPIAAGVFVETASPAQMNWLRHGAPWDLKELPVIGARYGDRTLAVIVPWPN